MKTRLYALPTCITGCDQKKYDRWLQRKAEAHVRRDGKRGSKHTVAEYKRAIHDAVLADGHLDHYTGEPLDWSLISTFRNAEAKLGRSKYKKTLWLLPTVDHTLDAGGKQKFVICSWKVNDAKGDLSHDEFCALCELVLKHRTQQRAALKTQTTA